MFLFKPSKCSGQFQSSFTSDSEVADLQRQNIHAQVSIVHMTVKMLRVFVALISSVHALLVDNQWNVLLLGGNGFRGLPTTKRMLALG